MKFGGYGAYSDSYHAGIVTQPQRSRVANDLLL